MQVGIQGLCHRCVTCYIDSDIHNYVIVFAKTGPFHTYILAYFSTLNYHNLLRMTSIEGLGIPGSANT